MKRRPLCKNCRIRPAAVNYIRNGVTHYRSKCESCISAKAGVKPHTPSWRLAGYKKKGYCEQCNFHAYHEKQMTVVYIDGNLKNNNWANLKTVCANCMIEISLKGLTWKTDELQADF